MPLREFRCRDCGNTFDYLVLKDADEAEATCPKCKSKNLERLLSVFGVAGAVEKPKTSGSGGCTSCLGGDCSTCGS